MAAPKPKPNTATKIVKTVKKVLVDPSSMVSRSKPKPKPTATKKATPSPSVKPKLGPLPKNPTLNDYLVRGLKPPVKKGTKLPSDADVKIKGYNA
jgi:hypothetical protein